MINTDSIRSVLEDLGYKLRDKGPYWQCAALYRGGDNETALQIYKDSGTWKDYVKDTPFQPFKQLLVLTLNTNDPKQLSKYLNQDDIRFLSEKGKNTKRKTEEEKTLSRRMACRVTTTSSILSRQRNRLICVKKI